ncbi:MAG: hypothetical protein JO344_00350 [Planctomycetaceae bacterium]|nr:hypothetical protein [Planctomycetaceae bacterium]
MPEFTLRITGPTACGSRISGPLLRDLLGLVSEGSRRALRMRVEGRSIAKGTPPAWLAPGAGFDFTGLSGGSCVVHIEAPTLAQAAPDEFAQGSLFLDYQASAVGLWTQSLEDALEGKADSELFDTGLLDEIEADLKRVFAHSIDGIEIANGAPDARPIVLKPESVERVQRLRLQTPLSMRVRVAGRLGSLRHSDRRFTLILGDGRSVTGIAEGVEDRHLASLWGQTVVVSGLAVFRPSGALLRIEADHIARASPADLEIWSQIPRPLGADLDIRTLYQPQGPRSGVNAFFGKWPGDETDEEINSLLEELS